MSGAEPPAGSSDRAPGQGVRVGAKPPEAERKLNFDNTITRLILNQSKHFGVRELEKCLMTEKLIPRLCGSDQSRRERKVEELVSFPLATSATTHFYANSAYSSDSAWK